MDHARNISSWPLRRGIRLHPRSHAACGPGAHTQNPGGRRGPSSLQQFPKWARPTRSRLRSAVASVSMSYAGRCVFGRSVLLPRGSTEGLSKPQTLERRPRAPRRLSGGGRKMRAGTPTCALRSRKGCGPFAGVGGRPCLPFGCAGAPGATAVLGRLRTRGSSASRGACKEEMHGASSSLVRPPQLMVPRGEPRVA